MGKLLRDLPICNNACIESSARICKESKKMVQEAVVHLFHFTDTQMRTQEADSIQIPYFGKFKLRYMNRKITKNAEFVRVQPAHGADTAEPGMDRNGTGVQDDTDQE